MKREFLTVSNLLSISRALLSIPFALVMLLPADPLRFWATGILLLGALTDKLDGDIARWRNEVTEWGKILDPLADKICVTVMSLVLLKLGDMPLWFVAALLSRDILILAGGMYLKSRRGVVLPSNLTGKWTATIIALTILMLLMNVLPEAKPILLAACTAGLVVSFALYIARFLGVLREAGA
jgi:CDP-diacylglycerol--glycerol-3-phosphate 3-phosphatidyltransferase